MAHYGTNYSPRGQTTARRGAAMTARKPKRRNPSIGPHVKRILAFERTPMEAWHEYQDELSYDSTERHAILIQAYARGMRSRSDTARMRLQQDKILMIQRMVRGKLARKYLRRIKMQYKYAAFMASRERKAVMKLELAFIKRRERKQQTAATIMQAHFLGRKSRQQVQDELMKRKLIYLMSKGEAKAALRIQLAWWRYRVGYLNQRREREQASAREAAEARAAQAEQERLARERQRDELLLQKPVAKKARSLPLGFQKKQAHVDGGKRVLSYWKYSEKRKAPVKEIPLMAVQGVEQRNGEEQWLLVLTLGGPAAIGAKGKTTRPYIFKLDDGETSNAWLRTLRGVCPHAKFTVSSIA